MESQILKERLFIIRKFYENNRSNVSRRTGMSLEFGEKKTPSEVAIALYIVFESHIDLEVI